MELGSKLGPFIFSYHIKVCLRLFLAEEFFNCNLISNINISCIIRHCSCGAGNAVIPGTHAVYLWIRCEYCTFRAGHPFLLIYSWSTRADWFYTAPARLLSAPSEPHWNGTSASSTSTNQQRSASLWHELYHKSLYDSKFVKIY